MLKLDFNERSDKNNFVCDKYAFGDLLWQYPDRQPLENQIAQSFGLAGEQVLVTNGGDEAIMLLMRMIKNNGKIILPLPAFSQYSQGIKCWQIECALITAKNDLTIDLEVIKQTILTSNHSVTILIRPNNPTGELIQLNDLIDLLEASQQNNNWIFLDEAYIEFATNNQDTTQLLTQFDNLIILRTLSKAYGLAGIRVGYLCGSKKLVRRFRNLCLPFNISSPSLIIASQALKNQNDIANYCSVIKTNRLQLLQWLNDIGIPVINSEANFILIKLPMGQAKAIQSFLNRNKILVRTFNQEELKQCIRITIPFNLTILFDFLQQALTPKLICLDMDGVLINTCDSYDKSIKATVKYFSDKDVLLADINFLRNSGGYNNDWLLSQKLLLQEGFDIDLNKVTEVFQSFYLGNKSLQRFGFQNNETLLISDKLVNKIYKATNINFAIVTGRPKSEAKSGQQKLLLSSLPLISLDDVMQAKPSPEGIKKLQNVYSNSSWMVGDNPDDIKAALASNSLALGIGIDKKNQQSLYDAGADFVFENINQLESWLCL